MNPIAQFVGDALRFDLIQLVQERGSLESDLIRMVDQFAYEN